MTVAAEDTARILGIADMTAVGRRLQEARQASGKTQQEAADALGVARTTVTAIEKGERRIKPVELIRLAAIYGRGVGEFLRSTHPTELFSVQLRATLMHDADAAAALAPVSLEFQALCGDYLELERICGAPLTRRYPSVFEAGTDAEEAAEDLTIAERNRLGLGDGPVLNLRELLENDVGLRIFCMRLPSKIAAMFAYTDDLGGCIAVNADHPAERRRMSLAHDYAHFLAHRFRAAVDLTGRYQRQPENERFAEAFARGFLMPAAGLQRRYHELSRLRNGSVTPADLCVLADLFFVSFEALLLRLEELHLVRIGTWDRLSDQGFRVREAQKLLGLERVDSEAQLLPLRYQLLAVEALERNLLSEGQFSRLLRLDRLAARELTAELSNQTNLSDQGTLNTLRLDFGTNIHTPESE